MTAIKPRSEARCRSTKKGVRCILEPRHAGDHVRGDLVWTHRGAWVLPEITQMQRWSPLRLQEWHRITGIEWRVLRAIAEAHR